MRLGLKKFISYIYIKVLYICVVNKNKIFLEVKIFRFFLLGGEFGNIGLIKDNIFFSIKIMFLFIRIKYVKYRKDIDMFCF